MRILAIDTSTAYFTLGIYDAGKVYEYNLELGRKLSALLHSVIKQALEAASLSVKDIDYFACGLGPGSFTGMRIGIACAKGLSWARKKPVIGICSLDILAKNAPRAPGEIIVAIDAKRSLIYCGIFNNKSGRLIRKQSYKLLSADSLEKIIKPGSLILGDGLSLYREKFLKAASGVKFLDKDCWYPKAHNLIELALERIKTKKLDNPFTLNPLYLYPQDCQVKK
ncbi:MAG: tRNA (adenosine(37)-N6)-threonylcarbamoyltransferase complex dimerization subunit type 1 TsaB [Candidatus Omnitrophota bacterium]